MLLERSMVSLSHSLEETRHNTSFLEFSWSALHRFYRSAVKRVREWVSSRPYPQKMGIGDDNRTQTRKYENIGPTAALVAYYRAFSDIPFARQVADEIQAEQLSRDLTLKDPILLSKMLVAFEARFKSIDAVLRTYPHITQFIEIPSGFSTRGISMTKNPAVSYVECDLPNLVQEKQKLAEHIAGAIPNLYFRAASIFDREQLIRTTAGLPRKPIAIITEGLFSYLTVEEKITAAMNVRALLAEYGGVWIVTDLTRLFKPDDAHAAELRQRIATATGFSPITGCFTTIREAKRFFRRLGFRIRVFRRSEVMDFLSTCKSSGLSNAEIRKLLKPQATFALEVRS